MQWNGREGKGEKRGFCAGQGPQLPMAQLRASAHGTAGSGWKGSHRWAPLSQPEDRKKGGNSREAELAFFQQKNSLEPQAHRLVAMGRCIKGADSASATYVTVRSDGEGNELGHTAHRKEKAGSVSYSR